MIRACLFGTYTSTHPANRLLVHALTAAGCELSICHEPLWERTRDKMPSFFGGRSLARLGASYAVGAARLIRHWRQLPKPEIVVTGFNGQLDVLLARRLAGRKARLVFAPLVTLTETLVDDRRVYKRGGMKARLATRLDRRTLRKSDLVLLDTEAHRAYVAERLDPKCRTATLYLGAEPIFTPGPERTRQPGDPLRVLFYGQYVPLHGVGTIIEAAALVGRKSGIEFTMIGTGPERQAAEEQAEARNCAHVRFEDWVPYEDLPERLRQCDVALGIFGATRKARMVIPTKVYQAAATGRAVITGETPAIREVFAPGTHLLTVPRGDPGAIAIALREMRDNPVRRHALGEAAARLLAEHLDYQAQGERLQTVLSEAFLELADKFVPPRSAEERREALGIGASRA
jgi:glycosyltransferase involved in cell wall biosynthesis